MTRENIETPGPNMDIYSSAYLAEYYEIIINSILVPSDTSAYWTAYKNMMSLRTLDGPTATYLVIDVGTGNGRIIREMATAVANAGLNLHTTEFIGLDTSQHMLDRAASIPIKPKPASVSWIHGSAVELASMPPFDKGVRKADLLVFGFGSISHLWRDGEAEQFLRQITFILRPYTGRAYISVHDNLTEGNQKEEPPLLDETPSKSFPNIIYRKVDGEHIVNGNRCTTKAFFEATKDVNDERHIVEKAQIDMDLRLWGKNEISNLASQCGLSLVDTVKGEEETLYVLAVDF